MDWADEITSTTRTLRLRHRLNEQHKEEFSWRYDDDGEFASPIFKSKEEALKWSSEQRKSFRLRRIIK